MYPAYWVKHTMPSHPIKWTRMASVPRKVKHVRCIDTRTENLNFFVSHSRQATIVAVVFISMDEDCIIDKYDFDNADIDFPALMVPRSVGDYFLKIMKKKVLFVGIKVSPGKYINFSLFHLFEITDTKTLMCLGLNASSQHCVVKHYTVKLQKFHIMDTRQCTK